jgi:hypothetical protein
MRDCNKKRLVFLGNLIYGAYYKYNDPKRLLRYLYDHLDKDQLEIYSGPRFFADVDNRLMSLLVKNGMTDAVMFDPQGRNILPAAILYKKEYSCSKRQFSSGYQSKHGYV